MSDTFGKLKELMAKAGHKLPEEKGSESSPFSHDEWKKLREDNTSTFPSGQNGDVPLTEQQQKFLGKPYDEDYEPTQEEIDAGTRSRDVEPDWMMENRLDALSEILNKKNRAPSSENN